MTKKLKLDAISVTSFLTTHKGNDLRGGITGGCDETVGAVCGLFSDMAPGCEVTNGPGCPLSEVGCSGTCTRGNVMC